MSSFKFIHAADIHLNSKMTSLRSRVARANTDFESDLLIEAPERAFAKLIAFARQEEIDFLVISGDLFDSDTVGFDAENFVIEQLRKLVKKGDQKEIPVYIIYGNHDAESKMQDRLNLPSNCHVFPTDRPETFDGPDGLQVKIHGQGFEDQRCTTDLASGYPDAVPGHFNIGLLHTSLSGYDGHDSYAPCSEGTLKSKAYDYWALGHIHRREEVSKSDPVILFPGNLQARHVNESGVKGATLVEVTDGRVQIEHIALDVGRWVRVEVDVTGIDTVEGVREKVVTETMKELTWDEDQEDQLEWVAIRVVLTGATTLHSELGVDRFAADVRNGVLEKVESSGRSFRVWVQDVERRTSAMLSLDEARKRTDAYGEVIRKSDSLDEETLEGMRKAFENLKKKALDEGYPTDRLEAFDPDIPANAERIRKAAQMELLISIEDD